jgi:hypothetical protein
MITRFDAVLDQYDGYATMEPRPDGEWVAYTEYQELVAILEAYAKAGVGNSTDFQLQIEARAMADKALEAERVK